MRGYTTLSMGTQQLQLGLRRGPASFLPAVKELVPRFSREGYPARVELALRVQI